MYHMLFCILLQLSADGQNEFVKNYLKQREQLMSQQMEQKMKCREGGLCPLIIFSGVEVTMHAFNARSFLPFAIRFPIASLSRIFMALSGL